MALLHLRITDVSISLATWIRQSERGWTRGPALHSENRWRLFVFRVRRVRIAQRGGGHFLLGAVSGRAARIVLFERFSRTISNPASARVGMMRCALTRDVPGLGVGRRASSAVMRFISSTSTVRVTHHRRQCVPAVDLFLIRLHIHAAACTSGGEGGQCASHHCHMACLLASGIPGKRAIG